jgi:RNA polymerase sigma-70 factor (ECF subfamily)
MGSHGHHHGQDWIDAALVTYQDRLLRYAQRILGDENRAQDAVQETFLKLCRENDGELNGHLAQWLYTVCRNQALDMLRKESRMTVLLAEHGQASRETVAPEQRAEEQDECSRLFLMVEQLPEEQQECLRLKFEHGLSYREIAGVLQCSPTRVGLLIHGALQRLKFRLDSGDHSD